MEQQISHEENKEIIDGATASGPFFGAIFFLVKKTPIGQKNTNWSKKHQLVKKH